MQGKSLNNSDECKSLTFNKCYIGGGGMVADEGGTSHNRICNNLKSDQMSGLKFFHL